MLEKVTTQTAPSGTLRFKYFARPCLPNTDQNEGKFILDTSLDSKESSKFNDPPTRTIGVQTQYRESETQTDPYSPPYKGNNAELLNLSHLSYQNGGLPIEQGTIGLARIQRMLERMSSEAKLTRGPEEASISAYKKFLEDQERKDFELREKELNECARDKLENIRKEIMAKDAESELTIERRVESFRRAKFKGRCSVDFRNAKKASALTSAEQTNNLKLQDRDIKAVDGCMSEMTNIMTKCVDRSPDVMQCMSFISPTTESFTSNLRSKKAQLLAGDLELITSTLAKQDSQHSSEDCNGKLSAGKQRHLPNLRF